ncbi:MAG: prephenate dehydrogenase [Bacteroidales bacterium]|nr:prephenate dehydrogenase [Bacteroidales bacterium]
MTAGIIGLGLIGGSIAADLRKSGLAGTVLGSDKSEENAAEALSIGLVDRIVPLDECVSGSEVIIVAVPVNAALNLLPSILDAVKGTDKVVMDVCSVKGELARACEKHPARGNLVLTHPMAGTEYSGPSAAMTGLFQGHSCIICDSHLSNPAALDLASKMYEALGMRIIHMDSESHDEHAAYVSHISHVISFALALTVLDKEKDDSHIFDMASGGFGSTARLAKSGAAMWTPIFLQNRENVLRVMDTYLQKIGALRSAIDNCDAAALDSLIGEANRIKRILK